MSNNRIIGLNIRWHSSIKEISECHWKILTGDQVNPFFRWSWLAALEDSNSVNPNQGWQPCHLSLWRGERPIAVAPLYLKAHSFGEFVFDRPFSQLAHELGLNYYPKLIGMSPLSPVEGYRFFIAFEEEEETITKIIMEAIDSFAKANGILSCNFLYVDPDWCMGAEKLGCRKWINQNSLWLSNGQKNFSDYLDRFNSNQRRNIKRERKSILNAGVKVIPLSGNELDVQKLECMYRFYEDHCSRWGAWGSKYLSEDFFRGLSKPEHRDKIVLFQAYRDTDEEPIAMSLCVTDNEKLWGRYWGANEEIPNLHFELCYYSPINWALENGISSFDPGAGGLHKLRRGFIAKPHASLHRWYDEDLNLLISAWLNKVNGLMINEIEAVNNELPFRLNTTS